MVTIVGKDQSLVKRISCGQCSSVLEYTLGEQRQSYSTDYLGDSDYYSYILCPCCGKQVVTRGN